MSSARSRERDESIALHEAGHAVVARTLGHEIDHASIEASEIYDGTVKLAASGRDPSLAREFDVWERITITLAGDLAARVLGDVDTDPADVGLCSARPDDDYDFVLAHDGDAVAVWHLASSTCGDEEEASALVAWLTARTRNLVRLHADAIRAVAANLRVRRALTQVEIDELLEANYSSIGDRGEHFQR
jgi:hypothetical protein